MSSIGIDRTSTSASRRRREYGEPWLLVKLRPPSMLLAQEGLPAIGPLRAARCDSCRRFPASAAPPRRIAPPRHHRTSPSRRATPTPPAATAPVAAPCRCAVAARVRRPAVARMRRPRSAPYATRGKPEATLLPRSCLPPPLSHHALVAAPPQLRAARPPRHRPPLGAPQAPAAGHWSPPPQSSRALAAPWRAGSDPSWIYREERGREMRTGWDPC